QGSPAWGSLSGPYGFGKTATGITLWNHARCEGFLAIPPLSCTNFDELAYGIAALAEAQAPEIKKQIQKLFGEVWTEGLNQIAKTDAKRYEMAPRKVRQILQDKLSAGQLTLDSRSHRLVEFLAKLGQIATEDVPTRGTPYKGLVIILDELQQLLGPLDARAIVRFREFVWGMRTERSHCGVLLALDTLLEARLARWAADVLHRIRENGPSLQLSDVYTREFPCWLWEKLTDSNDSRKPLIEPAALHQDVLLSLGQLVERPDLANGPRTVVDVFLRAAVQYKNTGVSYNIPDLVEDVHQGRFRYFGEGATIQRVLTQILSDEWIRQDETRETLVRTLAVFPLGCPQSTLQRGIPDERQFEKARSELYGPLLVELKDGLALEQLQQVRRTSTNWEQLLSRCWETLPALDVLAVHAKDCVLRILVPRLFPKGNPSNPVWERVSDESSAVLTGWHILRGTFDEAYPQREVALCVTDKEPESWPQDVDVCIALVCDASMQTTTHDFVLAQETTDAFGLRDADVKPSASLMNDGQVSGILMRLPVLRPLEEQLPAELERYRKYIQPEPFRPVTILTALHELESFLGNNSDSDSDSDAELNQMERNSEIRRVNAFVDIAVDFVLRELMLGTVDVGIGRPIQLRGPELLRALFTAACRHRFPEYKTLVKTAKWREILSTYRMGVRSDCLSLAQRQGRKEMVMPKAEMLKSLFGQTSAAAGTSFLKILGPLVETSGTTKSFSLRMTMHPAEVALLDYLKGLKSEQPIPLDAAAEFLRHQGYIHAETEEIVELLVDREFITKDKSGGIRVVRNANIERELLMEKISEMISFLRRLEVNDSLDTPSQTASIVELQNCLDILEERLRERVKEQVKELEDGADALREMIGTVRATTIPTDFEASDLSIHLTGVATTLKQTKESILKALRKELKRAEKELDLSSPADVEWAALWRNKRDSFSKAWQKLRKRVSQFEKQVNALALWESQNKQLRSTRELCAKVYDTEPGPAQTLDQLVDDFRERFATDSWGPVFASDEFSEQLLKIQSEVQGLLYSYVQTFNQELEMLKKQFKTLLPSTPPPTFDVSVESDEGYSSIHDSFQRLYSWGLDGFQSVVSDCRDRKQSGEQWRDPNNVRRGWKELDEQVEAAIKAASGALDFEMVQNIGTKVNRMLLGFDATDVKEEPIGLYDNPSNPPDFRLIEDLFLKGRIKIRVDYKSLDSP
ncbi:MAG: hypothetical protein ACE5PV_11160, partial [Candidatus Poribacteria bacterium]